MPEADHATDTGAMLRIGRYRVAAVSSAGAIAGSATVILVLYFGSTHIFPAMSRDGLLPPAFSAVNPRGAALRCV